MVSTIGNNSFIGQMLKGFGAGSRAGEASGAARLEDTVTLSPQSLAMQETIRQNGEAATSSLSEADTLTTETMAGLSLLA